MTLRTLTLADSLYVSERMRALDWACIRACTVFDSPEALAINRWQTEGPAWTLLDETGEPVAVGGIAFNVPWIGVCWIVTTDRMTSTTWKKAIRHVHTVLRNAAKQLPRVEAHVLSTWPQAEEFARRMGFELEGVRRRAGRDGQDVLTFVYRGLD